MVAFDIEDHLARARVFAHFGGRADLLPLATEIVESHVKRSDTLHTVRYVDPKTGDERALRIELVRDRWERVSVRKYREPRRRESVDMPSYSARDFIAVPIEYGPKVPPPSVAESSRRVVGPFPGGRLVTVLPYKD